MRSIAIIAVLASVSLSPLAAGRPGDTDRTSPRLAEAGRWRPAAAFQAPATLSGGGQKRPITVDDLWSAQRISDPQLSPDGSRAVYTLAVPDRAANRVARDVWIVSMAGGQARALTTTGRDSGARWSPDGRRIALVSSRGGTAQIHVLDTERPGDPEQLTRISGGADNLVPVQQAVDFHEALKKAGVTEKLVIYEGGGHSLGGADATKAVLEMVDFLNQHVKP